VPGAWRRALAGCRGPLAGLVKRGRPGRGVAAAPGIGLSCVHVLQGRRKITRQAGGGAGAMCSRVRIRPGAKGGGPWCPARARGACDLRRRRGDS
jgi:hypothetical protein